MSYENQYLVNFQYLGFRLHGWQKQPNLKTVHFFVDKTMKFVCTGIRAKTLGVGRTDAKVSACDYYFQLFIDKTLNEANFIRDFNRNSPSDIRVIGIKKIDDSNFNIIQQPKIKEYRYYFSHSEKNHPYAAALLVGVLDHLNIEKMKKGAKLFEGFHDFTNYCTKPSKETKVYRKIDACYIEKNIELTASFFPKESYVLIVKGEGFLRNQIRLIMGTLFELGKENITLKKIENSLEQNSNIEYIKTIAPASGLHLHKINFKEKK